MIRKALRFILPVVLAVVLFFGLQRLVEPKYMDGVWEGAFIQEYYQETTDHDVIMIGDCEVYENFDPITMWEEYGITSYIRGSAQQLAWQSYYLLEDTLRYETPKVVVFNVLSLKYNEPQREEYNRLNLEGMRWSKSKLAAIMASMTEEESLLDYIFPIFRYHSRITQLTQDDLTYFMGAKKVTHNGYYMRVDTAPATEDAFTETEPEDYTFGENAWSYLEKMTELCRENGIQLVLIKAPSLSPAWYSEWEEQIESYAEEQGLPYINYLELTDEIGIDYQTDTYDEGLHMNLSGAEKLSKHLGQYLQENFGLEDHRQDTELASVWAEKVAFHDEMEAAQRQELEEQGYLSSFGGAGTIQAEGDEDLEDETDEDSDDEDWEDIDWDEDESDADDDEDWEDIDWDEDEDESDGEDASDETDDSEEEDSSDEDDDGWEEIDWDE